MTSLIKSVAAFSSSSFDIIILSAKKSRRRTSKKRKRRTEKKLFEAQKNIINGNTEKAQEQMQESYQEQNEKNHNMYEGLIQKNVEMYDTKLKSFIPIFTEANARALAEVEKNNIETIANAYKAVQKLEDSQSGMMQAIAMVVKNISDDSKKIRQAITKDQTDLLDDKIEDLNENLKKIFSNFKNETTGNMKEHQDRMVTLEKQIEEYLSRTGNRKNRLCFEQK